MPRIMRDYTILLIGCDHFMATDSAWTFDQAAAAVMKSESNWRCAQALCPDNVIENIEKQFPTASRPGYAGNVKVGKRGRG